MKNALLYYAETVPINTNRTAPMVGLVMMHEAALKAIRKSDVPSEEMLDQFIDTMDAMESAEATLTQRIREKVMREAEQLARTLGPTHSP